MRVLHLHLEAAGGADAAHRRRRHADDEGVLHHLKLLVELDHDGLRRLVPSAARSSNGASGLKITAEFGALVKVAPSRPMIGTVWATPGVPSTILFTRCATSSVRASEAPGGNCTMLMR